MIAPVFQSYVFHPLVPITNFIRGARAITEGRLEVARPWIDSVRHLRHDTLKLLKRIFLAHDSFQTIVARAPEWPWVHLLILLPDGDIRALARLAVCHMDTIGKAEGRAVTADGEDDPATSQAGEWGWVWNERKGLVLKRIF